MTGLDQSLLSASTAKPPVAKTGDGDRGGSGGRSQGDAGGFDDILARTGNTATPQASDAKGRASDNADDAPGPSQKPLIDIRFQKPSDAEDLGTADVLSDAELAETDGGAMIPHRGRGGSPKTSDPRSHGRLSLSAATIATVRQSDADGTVGAEGASANERPTKTSLHAGSAKRTGAEQPDAGIPAGPLEVTQGATEPGAPGTATPIGQLFDLLGMTAAAGQPIPNAGRTATSGPERAGMKTKEAGTDLPGLTDGAVTADDGTDAVTPAHPKDKERLFRFARADGTGDAMTMRIGGDGGKGDQQTSALKAEPVTVLESRRYLGVALPANAQAVTNAIVSSMDGQSSLLASTVLSNPDAWNSAGKVLHTLKIQLNPVDLGAVTATMRLKDNELQVELKVASAEAFRQLSMDQEAMARALRDQGFAVDRISVVLSTAPDTSSGGQQNAQTGGGAGQMAGDSQTRQQASEGRAQDERRQGGHERAAGGDWRMNNASEGLAAASDRIRTDDVYI